MRLLEEKNGSIDQQGREWLSWAAGDNFDSLN